jgi:glyoxylase I family protein
MPRYPDYTFAHTGLNTDAPKEAAEWYVDNLSMKIARSIPPKVYFLSDPTGRVILEIYRNDMADNLPFSQIQPLTLHFAFLVSDVPGETDRLLSSGCKVMDDYKRTPAGDEMVILRDPFGLNIQLIRRQNPMF